MKKFTKKFTAILTCMVICISMMIPFVSYAEVTGLDNLVGRWERFGDGGEGTIVNVQKAENIYQATLEKATGTLVDLGFAVGDLKWKDIVWVSGTSYSGKDMFRYESGGYEYRNSNMIINAQGILEVSVYNGTDVNVIIGSYQTWRKLGTSANSNEAIVDLSKQIILQIGNKYMTINGVQKEIDPGKDTCPVILNERTVLPIRAIIEELGGTVGWDESQRKVTLQLNSKTLELWIGNKITLVNGSQVETDVAPQIINERTMIPLRYVIENLGYDVAWDDGTKKVTITY